MDWQRHYAPKVVDAQEAVSRIMRGSRVFIGTGCGEPQHLIRAMVKDERLQDIMVYQMLSSTLSQFVEDESFIRRFSLKLFFISQSMRKAAFEGKIDYIPEYLSQIPRLFASHQIGLDAALVQVCPPDKFGYCSLGVSVDITRSGMENADRVLAQVNPSMPRTWGDSFVHVDDIDYLVSLYDCEILQSDHYFKVFTDSLKKHGLYDDSIIIFVADHGEQFWEHGASLHGHTLYEEEIRIPAILFVDGIQKRFEDVPVIAADMVPTITDLAGYSIDPPYDDPRMGISLVPLILNDERDRYLKRDVVGRASFKRRYFLFRNWQWKLIYFAELDLLELLNVKEDPTEKKNLIEEKPELAAELDRLGAL